MSATVSYADPETVRVYEEASNALAEHMSSIGSRVSQIEHAFALAGSPRSAYVLEIGSGAGRDAGEIAARSSLYEGFDPSKAFVVKSDLLGIPNAVFDVADALSYQYGEGYDVIFAFASLLHLNRDDMGQAFQLIAAALKRDGIFYMTLKGAEAYKHVKYDDHFPGDNGGMVDGGRNFYYYTKQEVLDLAGGILELVEFSDAPINGIAWLTFAFKRA